MLYILGNPKQNQQKSINTSVRSPYGFETHVLLLIYQLHV